jgi:protein tyrosine phosphatase (PTP) superfamily phosphohydrolase (DUF442 family)
MIEWVIPARLARSSRPGFGGEKPRQVGLDEVSDWLGQARALGLRSILCLLDEEQLAYYRDLPEGLLDTYRRAGLAVTHLPVRDLQTPPIPEADLPVVWKAFRELPHPLLVHCSAGVDRTGAAVAHILRMLEFSP